MTYQMTQPYTAEERNPPTINNEIYNQSLQDTTHYKTTNNSESALNPFLYIIKVLMCGPGSSVGIVTGYGLDGPGSNPGGGEIFRTCPDRPWGPPSLL